MPSSKAKLFSILAAVAVLAVAAAFLFLPKTPDQTPESGGQPGAVRGQATPPGQPAQPPAAAEIPIAPPAQPQAAAQPQAPAQPPAGNATPSASSGIIHEDATVTFEFVEDAARFLLEKYRPALPGGQGTIALTFSKLSARYGVSPTGMARVADSIQKTRQFLLDYLLAPERLGKLHQAYADPFVTMLAWCAENIEKDCPAPGGGVARRLLTPAETAEMMRLYAGLARRSASVLSTLAAHQELGPRMAEFEAVDRKSQKANTAYQDLLNAYGHDSALRHEHAAELNQQAEALKELIAEREGLRKDIQQTVAKWCEACRAEDPAEVFAMAQWVRRRTANAPGKAESVAAGARLLEDMARRLEERAAAQG